MWTSHCEERRTWKKNKGRIALKPRFSKAIGHSAGSTKLHRSHCSEEVVGVPLEGHNGLE